MYTPEQQSFLNFVTQKVKKLFADFPVPAHSFDHAEAVGKYAREIAELEKANIWLCELAGILHDIGRVPEVYTRGNTLRHHEHSYLLLKEWFKEYAEFDILKKEEKIELLYALRYHWNDVADDYETAWVLRDADKIDLLGLHGVHRSQEWCNHIKKDVGVDYRLKYHCWYWMHTETARKMVQEKKLLVEVDEFLKTELKSQIEPIEL